MEGLGYHLHHRKSWSPRCIQNLIGKWTKIVKLSEDQKEMHIAMQHVKSWPSQLTEQHKCRSWLNTTNSWAPLSSRQSRTVNEGQTWHVHQAAGTGLWVPGLPGTSLVVCTFMPRCSGTSLSPNVRVIRLRSSSQLESTCTPHTRNQTSALCVMGRATNEAKDEKHS